MKRSLYKEGTCLDKFTIGKLLGQGSFGEVREAYYTKDKTKTPIALKIFKLGPNPTNQEIGIELVDGVIGAYLYSKECEVTRVLEAYKCSDNGIKSFMIAMDYIDGDTLQEFFTEEEVSNTLKFAITEKLLREFDHLHNQRVYHRDIKLANLMISLEEPGIDNDYINVFIIDFGLGCAKFAPDFAKFASKNVGRKILTDMMDNSCIEGDVGTRLYMPPEDFWPQYSNLSEEANMIAKDSYALGCALYEIWELDGRAIYSNMKHLTTFERIKNFMTDRIFSNEGPLKISQGNAPNPIIEIVGAMMSYTPHTRMTIKRAYELFLKSRGESLKFILPAPLVPPIAEEPVGPVELIQFPPGLNKPITPAKSSRHIQYPKRNDRITRVAHFRDINEILPKGLPSEWWRTSRMRELGFVSGYTEGTEGTEGTDEDASIAGPSVQDTSDFWEIPVKPGTLPPSGLRRTRKASERQSLQPIYKIIPPSDRPGCSYK